MRQQKGLDRQLTPRELGVETPLDSFVVFERLNREKREKGRGSPFSLQHTPGPAT